MNARKFSYFQRTLAVLFVLTGFSSQLQVVFACDLMDGQPRTVCCCGEEMSSGCAMGGGCAMDENIGLDSDCCEVSVDSLADIARGGPASTAAGQVALQNEPRAPPVALWTDILRPQQAFSSVSLPICHHTGRHFVRIEIYLLTQRLRI